MITGALVMGGAYLCYALIGNYALYPNNDSTQQAVRHFPVSDLRSIDR